MTPSCSTLARAAFHNASVNGNGGVDMLNASDAGTVAPLQYTLNATAITRTLGGNSTVIGYTNVSAVDVVGGKRIDSLQRRARAANTLLCHRRQYPTPPTNPGDVLTLDAQASPEFPTVTRVATGHAGTFTFSNRDAITYLEIETLAEVHAPVLNVTANPVNITYGTPLANSQLSGPTIYSVAGNPVTVPGVFNVHHCRRSDAKRRQRSERGRHVHADRYRRLRGDTDKRDS